jgi:hypothetical protein
MSARPDAYDRLVARTRLDIRTLLAAEAREDELSGMPKGRGVAVLALRHHRQKLARILLRRAVQEEDDSMARWARDQVDTP